MDTVIQHYKTFGKKLWVDFTVYDSIGKTMQKNGMSADGTASSVLRLAHNEKTQTKAEIYAHLADRNGALLVPFAVDTHGSFSPMDTSFQPKPYHRHGYGSDRNYNSTEPREVLEAIFKRTKGTPPARENSRMS